MSHRVYRFRDLKSVGVPYVRKHVTTLERLGEFPMHFQLGPNSVGWVASEVDEWIEARIRSRRPATAGGQNGTSAPAENPKPVAAPSQRAHRRVNRPALARSDGEAAEGGRQEIAVGGRGEP
jgi:prophage regulatory protein